MRKSPKLGQNQVGASRMNADSDICFWLESAVHPVLRQRICRSIVTARVVGAPGQLAQSVEVRLAQICRIVADVVGR